MAARPTRPLRFVSKVFDRDFVGVTIMTKNARVRSAFDLRKRLVNVGTLKWSFFTALRPRDASNAFEDFF